VPGDRGGQGTGFPPRPPAFAFPLVALIFVDHFSCRHSLWDLREDRCTQQDKPSPSCFPGVILGPVWPEKSGFFSPTGQAWGGAGMRQEKHLSQFSPAVGKRLVFPWSSSLLIPVFSQFSLSCFTFALAARLCCPASPPTTSAPVPLHVSLQARWDGGCSPSQMIDASPRRWGWGLWLRCYS